MKFLTPTDEITISRKGQSIILNESIFKVSVMLKTFYYTFEDELGKIAKIAVELDDGKQIVFEQYIQANGYETPPFNCADIFFDSQYLPSEMLKQVKLHFPELTFQQIPNYDSDYNKL